MRPISEALAVTRQIAEGDTSADISVRGTDETAQMMASMREMVHSLRAMVPLADASTPPYFMVGK